MSRLWLLVHSGVKGSCVFANRRDYQLYRREIDRVVKLEELRSVRGVVAWALLPATALLVVDVNGTPGCDVYGCDVYGRSDNFGQSGTGDEKMLSRLMTRLAVRHTCRKHGLTELPQALWSPTVSAVQIRSEQVWQACRFVEIASVRACLASTPTGWVWSSLHDPTARSYRARFESQPTAPECWESYLSDGIGRISQRILSAGVTAERVTYTRVP